MKNNILPLVLAAVLVFLLSACSGDVIGVPGPRSVPDGNPDVGRALIASYGCGTCHTIPGVPGADAKSAPPNAWPAIVGDTIIWPFGLGDSPAVVAMSLSSKTPSASPTPKEQRTPVLTPAGR